MKALIRLRINRLGHVKRKGVSKHAQNTQLKIRPTHVQSHLGPVVQSIVSLTSSLVVKMLTVLVSTISNSPIFLLKKCE